MLGSSSFLAILLTISSASHTTSHGDISHQHFVFIGDSIMRYTYLDFVYRLHYPDHQTPPKLLTCYDLPSRSTWQYFLNASTQYFHGSMICDCYRGEVFGRSDELFEIRYYHHPTRKISATYYQKFANVAVSGRQNLSDAYVYPTLGEAQKNRWNSQTYEDLVRDHISKLEPSPTVILLNQRFWVIPFRKIDIRQELIPFMKVALGFVDHVLWLEGTPTLIESTKKQYDFNPTDDFVRSILCNSSHPTARTISPSKFCKFVPFPSSIRRDLTIDPLHSYADPYHFMNSTVYLTRLQSALVSIGYSNISRHHSKGRS